MKQIEHLVLRFGKALTQEPGVLEMEPGHAPLWIALGYLDTLQIYPLPSGDGHWLERAYQNNVRETMRNDGRFYLHPIHISRIPAEDESETDFLSVPSPYLFVTMLQGQVLPPEAGGPRGQGRGSSAAEAGRPVQDHRSAVFPHLPFDHAQRHGGPLEVRLYPRHSGRGTISLPCSNGERSAHHPRHTGQLHPRKGGCPQDREG